LLAVVGLAGHKVVVAELADLNLAARRLTLEQIIQLRLVPVDPLALLRQRQEMAILHLSVF
jgi:hypothetical protein